MKKTLFTLAMGAILMAGCGNTQTNNTQSSEESAIDSAAVAEVADEPTLSFEELSGKWYVASYGEDEVDDTLNYIVLDIDSMRMGASAGCNSIGGEISRKGRSVDYIAFENVAATQMLCEDKDANERKLIDAINKTRSFRPEGKIISLRDENDSILLVLIK